MVRDGSLKHSNDELRRISEHLSYEIMMLFGTAWILAASRIKDMPVEAERSTVHNALIESFAIHARVLLDFLYEMERKQNDAIACDFFDKDSIWRTACPPKSGSLAQVHGRVGKEVAHLSYARINVSEEMKTWRYIELAREIRATLNVFVDMVPAQRIDQTLLNILKVFEFQEQYVEGSRLQGN